MRLLTVTPSGKRTMRRDDGYAASMTALLLVPLMLFAGLAVDLGGWYSRAAAVQRATDAAALAGAAALPRGTTNAQSTALAVAAQNGFSNDMDGITVVATPVPPDQMRVTITDDSVPQYLTSLINREVSITRTSLAEYIPPVKMGSPRNFLGTGTLLPPEYRENFWLAISSPCHGKENGDRIHAISNGNWDNTDNPRTAPLYTSSWVDCAVGGHVVANQEYSPDGYFYAMRLTEDYSGSLEIQVYDGAYCGNSSIDSTNSDSSNHPFTTTYTVRRNDAANPLEATPIGAPIVVRGRSGNSQECRTVANGGWRGGWVTLRTLNNPTRGIYFIQIQTSNPHAGYEGVYGGSNQFGLRVVENGTFSPCTTDPADGAVTRRDNCPNLFGLEHLGVSANIPAGKPSFFLADIGPEHSGKTLEIELWDPGEGAELLEILDPNGDEVTFRWRVQCNVGDVPPTGGCGPGTSSALDLIGNVVSGSPRNPQPAAHRASASKYSDRLLVLSVDLPENIATAYGGSTWWRIRYTVGSGSPTDRTTWSVQVRGDPVRLVE